MAVTVEVEPYNQDRWRKRSKIKIFYVGVQFHKDHKGDPPPVNVKGMAIPYPALGEWLEIDEVYARDLIQKSRYQQKPVYMAERDGGGDVAKMIKQALSDGTPLADFDLNKVKARQEAKQMSDEDLLAVIQERKNSNKLDPALLRELLGDVPMEPVAQPSAPQIPVPMETEIVEDTKKTAFKPKSFK